jgi:hypothetical protein
MHKLLILIAFIATLSAQVHIKDVQVITLYSNEYTSGRRNAPIPQLQCTGPACFEGALRSMQCTNMGFDGTDANWDCKSNVGNRFTLGKVSVSCEGYESPNDEFILAGSCGVVYELNYNSNTHNTYPNTHNNHHDVTVTTWWDPLTGRFFNTYSHPNEAVVVLLLLLFVFSILLCISCSRSHDQVVYTGPGPQPSYNPSPTYYPSSIYYAPRPSYWSSWSNPVPVAQTTFSSNSSGSVFGSNSSGSHTESRGSRTTRR